MFRNEIDLVLTTILSTAYEDFNVYGQFKTDLLCDVVRFNLRTATYIGLFRNVIEYGNMTKTSLLSFEISMLNKHI